MDPTPPPARVRRRGKRPPGRLPTDTPLPVYVIVRSHGFIPPLYQTEPRQMYYHTMTALNDIGPGGAPFTIVDGIYPKIKKVIESFDSDYMATLVGEDFRGAKNAFWHHVYMKIVISPRQAREKIGKVEGKRRFAQATCRPGSWKKRR